MRLYSLLIQASEQTKHLPCAQCSAGYCRWHDPAPEDFIFRSETVSKQSHKKPILQAFTGAYPMPQPRGSWGPRGDVTPSIEPSDSPARLMPSSVLPDIISPRLPTTVADDFYRWGVGGSVRDGEGLTQVLGCREPQLRCSLTGQPLSFASHTCTREIITPDPRCSCEVLAR